MSPFEIKSIESCGLYDLSSGQKLMDLTDTTVDSVIETIGETEEYIHLPDFNRDSEFVISGKIDEPIINAKFLDTLLQPYKDTYTLYYKRTIRIRKPKKKWNSIRSLNQIWTKKWGKKYEYKNVEIQSDGWKLKSCVNGSIEFVKE